MDLARDCVQMDRDGSSYDIPQSFNTEGHYLM
jgi:hypothetical protein